MEICNNLKTGLFFHAYVNVRIGILANDINRCHDTDTFLGFGISVNQCSGTTQIPRNATCGNMAVCGHLHNFEFVAFGHILVQ